MWSHQCSHRTSDSGDESDPWVPQNLQGYRIPRSSGNSLLTFFGPFGTWTEATFSHSFSTLVECLEWIQLLGWHGIVEHITLVIRIAKFPGSSIYQHCDLDKNHFTSLSLHLPQYRWACWTKWPVPQDNVKRDPEKEPRSPMPLHSVPSDASPFLRPQEALPGSSYHYPTATSCCSAPQTPWVRLGGIAASHGWGIHVNLGEVKNKVIYTGVIMAHCRRGQEVSWLK